MDKKTEKTDGKQSEKPWLFKPGESGNPKGRPKGTENFKTKWEKFVKKIADKNELLPEDIDEQLLAVAYKKAKDGDFQFYKDIHDRVHGKAMQPTDITTGGETLGVVILPNRNDSKDTLEATTETGDSSS